MTVMVVAVGDTDDGLVLLLLELGLMGGDTIVKDEGRTTEVVLKKPPLDVDVGGGGGKVGTLLALNGGDG